MRISISTITQERNGRLAAVKKCDGATIDVDGRIWIDANNECYKTITQSAVVAGPPDNSKLCTAGTELMAMMKQLHISTCSACLETAKSMDRYGIEWCRQNRNAIAASMASRAARMKVRELVAVGVRVVVHGYDFIDPKDVFGSLVDEAVRRAKDYSDKTRP